MRARGTPALVAALAALLIIDVVTIGVRGGSSSAPATARVASGPTALQLADGKWVAIPKPPIRECDPLTTPAGRYLYVLEYGYGRCAPAAARYDAVTNTWERLSPPPAFSSAPSVVWAGFRLIVVVSSGATFSYDPITNHWRDLGELPAVRGETFGIIALLWTGQDVIANAQPQGRVRLGGAATYSLGSDDRWRDISYLHAPRGLLVDAPMTQYEGKVYAWASTGARFSPPHQGSYRQRLPELHRFDGSSWALVGALTTGPLSDTRLTAVTGGVFVQGSLCPLATPCTGGDVAGAIIVNPVTGDEVTTVRPPQRLPIERDVAAGPGAVVVTYPDGALALGGITLPPIAKNPAPGTTAIYDIARRAWLEGPRAPTTTDTMTNAFWTTDGVVLLRLYGGGGWLLRPGP